MESLYQFKSSSSYRFKYQIGSGGSADVFLYARQTPGFPDQEVVLKILKNEDPQGFAELLNDGHRLSQLKHPNIVTTFGYEKISPTKVGLILEYIPGCNLSVLIPRLSQYQRRILTPFIIRAIAEAIATAHEQEIVHGDISSRNILVSNTGQMKLSDFGLAMRTTSVDKRSEKPSKKGSIDYWGPTRWQSKGPSAKCDIFSLGILAFELLTGGNPLRAGDLESVQSNLSRFLEVKPWNYFADWKEFFDFAFSENQEGLSGEALYLLNLIPPSDQKLHEVQKIIGQLLSGPHETGRLLETTQTVTRVLSRLVERKSNWSTRFTATVLLLLTLFLPGYLRHDLHVTGRLRAYSLTVTSNPWGEVFIDGKSVGYTPLLNGAVGTGFHRFLWKSQSGEEVKKSFNAFENGSVFLKILGQKKLPGRGGI